MVLSLWTQSRRRTGSLRRPPDSPLVNVPSGSRRKLRKGACSEGFGPRRGPKMDIFLEHCLEAIRRFEPTLVYIITDSEDIYHGLQPSLKDRSVIVLTSNRELERKLKEEPITVQREMNLPKDILLLSSLRHY